MKNAVLVGTDKIERNKLASKKVWEYAEDKSNAVSNIIIIDLDHEAADYRTLANTYVAPGPNLEAKIYGAIEAAYKAFADAKEEDAKTLLVVTGAHGLFDSEDRRELADKVTEIVNSKDQLRVSVLLVAAETEHIKMTFENHLC